MIYLSLFVLFINILYVKNYRRGRVETSPNYYWKSIKRTSIKEKNVLIVYICLSFKLHFEVYLGVQILKCFLNGWSALTSKCWKYSVYSSPFIQETSLKICVCSWAIFFNYKNILLNSRHERAFSALYICFSCKELKINKKGIIKYLVSRLSVNIFG